MDITKAEGVSFLEKLLERTAQFRVYIPDDFQRFAPFFREDAGGIYGAHSIAQTTYWLYDYHKYVSLLDVCYT